MNTGLAPDNLNWVASAPFEWKQREERSCWVV